MANKKIINWTYKEETLEVQKEDYDKVKAFVYLVTYLPTNKKYIGKKYLWKKIRRPPLKGKKRVRIDYVPSDWKTYTTSCLALSDKILEEDLSNFKFEVLHLCESKGLASYLELKEQISREVLLNDEYWNGIIQCRINASHIKGLLEDEIEE